jgi:integrase
LVLHEGNRPRNGVYSRTIALPQVAIEALRAHRTRQLEERLLAGECWQESGLVFTTVEGKPLDARNVFRGFQRLLTRARLPHLRLHDLRHGCATLLIAQGVHPRTIMKILGHSQISLTMNTYGHVTHALQRDAATRVNAVFATDIG